MKAYFQYRKLVDFLISTILSFIVICCLSKGEIFDNLGLDLKKDFLLTLFNTSASLLGFVLAASTFLISHVQGRRFKLINSGKSFEQLTSLVASNLWRLLFLTIFSVIAVFAKNKTVIVIDFAIIFTGILSIIALGSLIWVVIKIYAIPIREPD